MMSSTASLPIPAKMRLTRELSLFSKSPPPGISCYTPNDTLTHLHAQITGPPDSPFEKGCFLLVINIPMRYPFEPPRARFLTPIHHPNIDSQGRICLDSLKSQPNGSWSPAISLPSLLLQIRTLMGEPNAEDGLVADVTEQYKSHYDQWFEIAKRMTLKDATDEKLVIVEQEYLKSLIPKSNNGNVVGCKRGTIMGRRNGLKRKAVSKLSSRSTTIDKENQHHDNDSNSMDTDEVRLSGTKRKDVAQDETNVRTKKIVNRHDFQMS